jgi:2-oxo-4-hydroxy-4-carboxy-5-ureidoimidazoline decarboxylase
MKSAKHKLMDLNALDQDAFTAALGWVFEDSPWVMRETWLQRPFASIDALHRIAISCVDGAPREKQLALLVAHPDLGTRAKLSDASQGEQSGAGLASLTVEEFARLRTSNNAYRERFGFPFLYAVKGSDKHDILHALEHRLAKPAEQEFQEALRQVYCIARFRLEDAIS